MHKHDDGDTMPTTAEALKPLLWEPKNLVRAVEAAGVTLWSWNVDTDALGMDDRAYDLWGCLLYTSDAADE